MSCKRLRTMEGLQSGEESDHNNGVKPRLGQKEDNLQSAATQAIDDFFVFPPENRPDIPHDKYDLEIPVIDMSPVLELEKLKKELAAMEEEGKKTGISGLVEQMKACEAAKLKVQTEIGAACEEYGFFQIVNHGVPPQLMKQLVKCCQNVFDLPVEKKMKSEGAFTPNVKSGYGPMTRITKFSMIGKSHIWNEGFDLESPEVSNPGRMEEVARILWPDEPEHTTLGLGLKSTSEQCGKELSNVTMCLLDVMAGSLGVSGESLDGLMGPEFRNKQAYARVRVNHYPQCVEAEKTWGFPGHTDSSVITVLHQDAVGGLQVRFKDGSWHGVRPIDGALVINVGNFLQVWTNRKFISAEHRVVTNSQSSRISVAYFVHQMDNFDLEPCPELLDAEHPARYRSFTKQEYFETLFAVGMGEDRDQLLDTAFGTNPQTEELKVV
ncbi:unnamed protein product [Calypogeia fissa]